MKILHISKYYFPFFGGVENICRYFVEQMPRHKTSVVCFNTDKGDSIEVVNGHKVWRAGSFINIARQALSLSYKKILKNAINSENPDIIQFHWANPYPAIFLKTLLPKQTKLVVHWHMDIIRQWYLYWAVKPWEKWLVNRADIIAVTSPQYRDGSKPLRNVKEKVRIVPNAIDDKNFELQPDDDVRIKKIKDRYGNRPIVFFMGRHTKYKGLLHLINAAKYIDSDCAIVIGGRGPLTEKLKRQAQKNGDNRIYFVGKLSEDDLRCHLYAADIFAFPSVTKNEAFGVALAEAMYCYNPAVTFTIEGSGVNWVNLDGVTGIEVKQDSKMDENYAKAIDCLIKDPDLRNEYSDAAHKRIKDNFLMKHMLSAMENVYSELM